MHVGLVKGGCGVGTLSFTTIPYLLMAFVSNAYGPLFVVFWLPPVHTFCLSFTGAVL